MSGAQKKAAAIMADLLLRLIDTARQAMRGSARQGHAGSGWVWQGKARQGR